ncbi:MAG: hypothetical protein M3171_11695 [Actinomycetota bacterium]|nr:hypothetical protein [Actinomycetota bacterium]
MVDAIEVWKDFNVAMVGALAALGGLVIVAASVNIADIVKEASLVARLAAGVATLVLGLVVAAVGLMPGLPLSVYGIVVLAATVVVATFQVVAARHIFRDRHPQNRMRPLKAVIGFLPLAAYLVGGLMLVVGSAGGLPLLALGSMLAIVSGLLVSWIVLVEVLR